MIENVQELATQIGSRAKDTLSCEQDVQHAVETHTEGTVTLVFTETQVRIRNTQGVPISGNLLYPFQEDVFWKEVEWVEDETVNYVEEDDEEDIRFSLRNKRPHEFYD